MASPNYARIERDELCDLLTELGPDRPTLCPGWQTRDLAAHLVIRERRPDAAAGIMLKFLAGHTAKVQSALAGRPFDQVIEQLRHPPRWSPLASIEPLDRATNTQEFFIHHEDVRRAQPDWQPRELPEQQSLALWSQTRGMGRLRLRGFPASILLAAPGFGEVSTGTGPQLRVAGDPGELALFLSGRQRVARVEITGPQDVATRLREAKFGV